MNKPTTIVDIRFLDIRFPTSLSKDGSDAMNPDPDYSAAYAILITDHPDGLEGHGLTFTIGRGNEICLAALEALAHHLRGKTLEAITSDMAAFFKDLTTDSQLRWLGPEKGVIHLATAALVNAVWDLYAKSEGKPLWKLLADLSPEELVRCIDFSYISDALTPAQALEILRDKQAGRQEREEHLLQAGYPAYTTSAGWLGYSDEKIKRLCTEAREQGFRHMKMKVGANLEQDVKRAAMIRDAIGPDARLMMDANQKWGVEEAISAMEALSAFNPLWIEEPTNPDDVLGHARISRAIAPVLVATGEHCHNRVMFKQFMQAGAMQVCQIDSCRVGGVNENLAILLLAARFNIPVCPHAGGVGLCEYVQHLAMFDYLAVSGTLEGRLIEYVDHLHEHFLDPVVLRNARYQAPKRPGYSIEMKPESLRDYRFPDGPVWKELRASGRLKTEL